MPAGPGDPAAPLGATDGSSEADAGASDGGDGDDVACVPPHAATDDEQDGQEARGEPMTIGRRHRAMLSRTFVARASPAEAAC